MTTCPGMCLMTQASMSFDQHPGCDPVLGSLCAPQTGSHSVQPLPSASMQYAPQPHPNLVTFPYLYPANINQCNQQNTTEQQTQVIYPEENSVFMSDGVSWNKVNLEKIFSGQIPGPPCQESPCRGT